MTIFVIVSNKFTGSYSSYLLESAGKVGSPADKRWKIWDHDIKGGQRGEGKFQIVKNTGKNICRKSLSKNMGPLYRMSQLMFCWHSLCEKKRIWDTKGFISTDWTKVVGAVAGSQREECKCQIVYKMYEESFSTQKWISQCIVSKSNARKWSGSGIAHISHDWRWCTFFQAGAPFSIQNAQFWPLLPRFGHFGYFVTNLRTFWFPLLQV